MEEAATNSPSKGELKADEEGGDWKGANEENGTKIRKREVQKQLQQTSPAAASHCGLAKGDKIATETAADGAAARGRRRGHYWIPRVPTPRLQLTPPACATDRVIEADPRSNLRSYPRSDFLSRCTRSYPRSNLCSYPRSNFLSRCTRSYPHSYPRSNLCSYPRSDFLSRCTRSCPRSNLRSYPRSNLRSRSCLTLSRCTRSNLHSRSCLTLSRCTRSNLRSYPRSNLRSRSCLTRSRCIGLSSQHFSQPQLPDQQQLHPQPSSQRLSQPQLPDPQPSSLRSCMLSSSFLCSCMLRSSSISSSIVSSEALSEAGRKLATLTFASSAAPHPSGPHYARHTVPAAAVNTDAANAPALRDRPPSYEAGRRSLAGWAVKVKAAAANAATPTHAPPPPQQLPAAAHAQPEHGSDGSDSAIEGNSNFQTTENDSPPPPVSY